MILGWKNNPQWVTYYQNRDYVRKQSMVELQRKEADHELQKMRVLQQRINFIGQPGAGKFGNSWSND